MTDQHVPPFAVRVEQDGDCEVLHVTGEVDMAVADQFQRAIVAAEPGRNLIIDMSELSFMDSSGARAVVVASRVRQASGTSVSLVSPPGDTRVRRVLDLLHMTQAVPVHDDYDEAAEASDC